MAEANRDEGLKCLHIAQEALRAGNLDKADRFGQKAKRLFQNDEVRASRASREGAASCDCYPQGSRSRRGRVVAPRVVGAIPFASGGVAEARASAARVVSSLS